MRRRRGRGATTWLLFPSPPDHALALQAFSHCKEIADARTAAATLEVQQRRRRRGRLTTRYDVGASLNTSDDDDEDCVDVDDAHDHGDDGDDDDREGGLFGRLTTRRYNVGAAALHGSTTHTKTALNCGFLNILEKSTRGGEKIHKHPFQGCLVNQCTSETMNLQQKNYHLCKSGLRLRSISPKAP